jgi:hypothetical protein
LSSFSVSRVRHSQFFSRLPLSDPFLHSILLSDSSSHFLILLDAHPVA